MASPQDVGRVLLLRLHKAPLLLPSPVGPLARDAWFCNWLQLTPPQGAPLRFPCYQWMEGSGILTLREGAGGRGGAGEGGAGGEERASGGRERRGERTGKLVWPLGRWRG